MHKFFFALVVSALLTPPLLAENAPAARTPGDVIAAAPTEDWVRIAPSDLVVMDLAADGAGKARRIVIQLISPPFSQGWVGNIRKLVAARWYDGIAVVRVQDNYVVQWGDPDGENPKKAKPLPAGLAVVEESDYIAKIASKVIHVGKENDPRTVQADLTFDGGQRLSAKPITWNRDAYAANTMVVDGWPVGVGPLTNEPVATGISANRSVSPDTDTFAWPTHCYGMVGVGRNNSPDTGTGAELYAVIGQAPRQLDRNIAVVGRVISGMENLSALPRGTGEIGFYKTPPERVAIRTVRMGSEVPGLPAYEYLSTESPSFAAYVDKRANRQDDFYIHPAGGVDVCNVPVPIREVKP